MVDGTLNNEEQTPVTILQIRIENTYIPVLDVKGILQLSFSIDVGSVEMKKRILALEEQEQNVVKSLLYPSRKGKF